MFSIIASWIGWRFIPDLVSRVLLGYFHKFYASVLGRQPPHPNSPEYIKHRRYLYSFVVFCYMTYTFEQAATSIGPNYYELLGVLPTTDEAGLKAGFRAFARKYHPDRAGPEAEPLFMEIRDAYEALKNPITRFAYDRFGPSALTWNNCTTMQDYITHGLYQSTAIYVVGICALLFWNKIAPRDLAFWNYIIISATFAYELLYIFSPSPSEPSSPSFSSLIFTDPISPSSSGMFAFIWPYRVAYQHISFMKSLSVLFSSALYQVLPNLFPSIPDTLDPQQLNGFFNFVNTSLQSLETETYSMINTELHSCQGTSRDLGFPHEPCQPSRDIMALIDEEIQNVILENSLYTQGGPLQSMIQQIQRRWRRSTTPGHALPHPTPSEQQADMSKLSPSSSLDNYVGINRGRSRSCDT